MGRTTHYAVRPPFVVDQESLDRNSGRQIDWSVIPEKYKQGSVLVTMSTNADSGATTLPVTAITGAIPSGALLYFGQAGEFARLSAAAAAGTTSIPVDATGTTIESGDTATFAGTGDKFIPAGKVIVELTSGKIALRSDRPGSEEAAGVLETNAIENDPSAALTGYGVIIGGVLYENLLPDASTYGASNGTLPDAYKTELVNATNPKTTGFAFEKYRDTRS